MLTKYYQNEIFNGVLVQLFKARITILFIISSFFSRTDAFLFVFYWQAQIDTNWHVFIMMQRDFASRLPWILYYFQQSKPSKPWGEARSYNSPVAPEKSTAIAWYGNGVGMALHTFWENHAKHSKIMKGTLFSLYKDILPFIGTCTNITFSAVFPQE